MKSSQQPATNESTLVEQIDENDRSLEQHLWNISQASEDGRIRGYINKCELTDDGSILVHVQLPNAETYTQTFPMPRTDSTEYTFVRLVEDCGYSLSSVGQLAGEGSTSGSHVWCKPVNTSEPVPNSGESDTKSISTDLGTMIGSSSSQNTRHRYTIAFTLVSKHSIRGKSLLRSLLAAGFCCFRSSSRSSSFGFSTTIPPTWS